MKNFFSFVLVIALSLGILCVGVGAYGEPVRTLIIASTINKGTPDEETIEIYRTDSKKLIAFFIHDYTSVIEIKVIQKDDLGTQTEYTAKYTHKQKSLFAPSVEKVFKDTSGLDTVYPALEEKQIYDYIKASDTSLGQAVSDGNDKVAQEFSDEAKKTAVKSVFDEILGFFAALGSRLEYKKGNIEFKDLYEEVAKLFLKLKEIELGQEEYTPDQEESTDTTLDSSKYASGIAETMAFNFKVFVYRLSNPLENLFAMTDARTNEFHTAFRALVVPEN